MTMTILYIVVSVLLSILIWLYCSEKYTPLESIFFSIIGLLTWPLILLLAVVYGIYNKIRKSKDFSVEETDDDLTL